MAIATADGPVAIRATLGTYEDAPDALRPRLILVASGKALEHMPHLVPEPDGTYHASFTDLAGKTSARRIPVDIR